MLAHFSTAPAPGLRHETRSRHGTQRPLCSLFAVLALGGLTACSTLAPREDGRVVRELASPRLQAVADVAAQSVVWPESASSGSAMEPSTTSEQRQKLLSEWLREPMNERVAVQIALLNSPAAHAALARLGISDAERVLASNWAAPHFSFASLTKGDEREWDRGLSFNILGLLTLPWQAELQNRAHEINRLQTAQELVQLAARSRKAWVQAVAAQQSARYMADALEAAQASAELARRMVRAGNWSQMQQRREQLQLAEVQAQLQRAQHQALVERETLARLLGLSGEQLRFTLPDRLPDVPAQIVAQDQAELRAMRERLDVQAAGMRVRQQAQASDLEPWQVWAAGSEWGWVRNTSTDRSTGDTRIQRGWELSLPLPLMGGSAREARADARLREASALLRETGLLAASEARLAWSAYASAHALARQYRQELVPLRQQLSEDVLQRYNGMLMSVFDLLTDARSQIAVVNAALQAERDFWLAQTDFQTVLSGSSPTALTILHAGPVASPRPEAGH